MADATVTQDCHPRSTDLISSQDASGFLDNSEEIKQLCVNLCFSLKIHRGIEVVLDEAQKIPEGTRFNLQQITAWLLTTFVYEDLREQGGLVQVTGIR